MADLSKQSAEWLKLHGDLCGTLCSEAHHLCDPKPHHPVCRLFRLLVECAMALADLEEEASLYLGRLAPHDAQMIGNEALVAANTALANLLKEAGNGE